MSETTKQIRSRTKIQTERCNYTWLIENFTMCAIDTGEHLASPPFTTGNTYETVWQLSLYPNGRKKGESDGKISIYLSRATADASAHYATFKIGFLNLNNILCHSVSFEHLYQSPRSGWGCHNFVDRKVLLENEGHSLLPSDTLKVFCELKVSRVDDDVYSEIETGSEVSPASGVISNLKEFSADFKVLYENGLNSDMTVKVGNTEMKVHKSILAARSVVFEAMLKHEMSETINECIEITDFEADVVQAMIKHIYSGEAEVMPPEKSFQLYMAAEKYALNGLKQASIQMLLYSLSAENVCDVMMMADMHNEIKLKEACKNYFRANAPSVIVTEKWQCMLLQKPEMAQVMIEEYILERNKKVREEDTEVVERSEAYFALS